MLNHQHTLSVSMIVRNEERHLGRLLQAVRGFADEIVITDTGSTDQTVDIALAHGATVRHFTWCDDFAAARNASSSVVAAANSLWREGISLRDVINNFERRLIESTLEATGGVQKEAARLLGLKPTTLNEMIKRHNILLPRERERRAAKEVDETTEKPTPA